MDINQILQEIAHKHKKEGVQVDPLVVSKVVGEATPIIFKIGFEIAPILAKYIPDLVKAFKK